MLRAGIGIKLLTAAAKALLAGSAATPFVKVMKHPVLVRLIAEEELLILLIQQVNTHTRPIRHQPTLRRHHVHPANGGTAFPILAWVAPLLTPLIRPQPLRPLIRLPRNHHRRLRPAAPFIII